MDWIVAALIVTQLFWAGLMWFSQTTTYPLFGAVPSEAFGELHRTYERGLPLGVYLPFALMLAAVAAVLILRPEGVASLWLWMSAIAALGGIAMTALCAAPLHIRLIRDGLDHARVRLLLRCNAARTAFSVLGGAAAIGILAT